MRFSGVQSEKLLRRKRRRLYTRLTLGVLLVVSVIAGLSKISSWSKLTVPEVIVRGNDVIRTEDVVALANQHMDGNYLFLFSKRNIFLYPKDTIEQNVSDEFKRIKNIRVGLEEKNVLTVDVVEREPAGLWCNDTCYYLDDSGYIFEEAPQFSNEVYVTYKGAIEENPIGQTFLTKDDFGELRAFIYNVERLGFSVTAAIKGEHDEYEVRIKNTGQPGENEPQGTIYFNKKQSFDESFDNLSTFVAQYSAKKPEELKSIDYIDLRFGKNIVFKFN